MSINRLFFPFNLLALVAFVRLKVPFHECKHFFALLLGSRE